MTLCDGIGGHAAGEVAAQIAGTIFLEAFDDFRKAKPPREVAAITLALFIRLRNDLKISG